MAEAFQYPVHVLPDGGESSQDQTGQEPLDHTRKIGDELIR